MVPIEKFTDVDFGNCKVLFKNERELKDVCFFASHTILPFIPYYVFYNLEVIKRTNFTIVFVSSSPICENDIVRLSRCADIIIEKENRGTDFGAWCAVLRWLNYGKEFQNLYLCNDSVFGLFESFENINKRFQIIENDLLGITDSHQSGGYHILKFFFCVLFYKKRKNGKIFSKKEKIFK